MEDKVSYTAALEERLGWLRDTVADLTVPNKAKTIEQFHAEVKFVKELLDEIDRLVD